jgi:hypothetical protein
VTPIEFCRQLAERTRFGFDQLEQRDRGDVEFEARCRASQIRQIIVEIEAKIR